MPGQTVFDSLPEQPKGFWENAWARTKDLGSGIAHTAANVGKTAVLGAGVNTPGTRGAASELMSMPKELVAAPLRELKGQPQPGETNHTPPNGIGERVLGAADIAMGGNPNEARAAKKRGDTAGEMANYLTVPAETFGLAKLLGGALGVKTPAHTTRVNKIASALQSAGRETETGFPVDHTIKQSLPWLDKARNQLPDTPLTLQGFKALTAKAKKMADASFNKYLAPIANQQTMPAKVSKAITDQITPYMRRMSQEETTEYMNRHPKAKGLPTKLSSVGPHTADIGELDQMAQRYGNTPWTFQELNSARTTLTDMRKETLAGRMASRSNAIMRAEEAAASALKEEAYGGMDAFYKKPGAAAKVGLANPETEFAKLKAGQSALIDLDRMANKAYNIERGGAVQQAGREFFELGSPSVSLTKRGFILGTHQLQKYLGKTSEQVANRKVAKGFSTPRFGKAAQAGAATAAGAIGRAKAPSGKTVFDDQEEE